jgi:hypothetical protein
MLKKGTEGARQNQTELPPLPEKALSGALFAVVMPKS